MEIRPKGMARWEWERSLEKEREDAVHKESLEIPEKSNILGIILTGIVMVVVVWIIFLSMSGGADNSCDQGYHWEEDARQIIGGCVED